MVNYVLRQNVSLSPLVEFINKFSKIPFDNLNLEEISEIIQVLVLICEATTIYLNSLPPLDAPPPPKARERKILKRKYSLVGRGNSKEKIKKKRVERQYLNIDNMTDEEIIDETLFNRQIIMDLASKLEPIVNRRREYDKKRRRSKKSSLEMRIVTRVRKKKTISWDLGTRLIIFFSRLKHAYTYKSIMHKFGMSPSTIVREKYILTSSVIFLLRNEITFDANRTLGKIIGFMDHTHLPTSKHHARSKELFRTDKGAATILMMVIGRSGKLLYASGGVVGRSNDKFVVALTHLENLILENEVVYGDDGFFENKPKFIHTPKYLRKIGQSFQRLSSFERNSIEMFFRLPKMFRILRTPLREKIGIQTHYFLMLAQMFSRYMKDRFINADPDPEIFQEMIDELDSESVFTDKFKACFYGNKL
jgi:hypothetical protein